MSLPELPREIWYEIFIYVTVNKRGMGRMLIAAPWLHDEIARRGKTLLNFADEYTWVTRNGMRMLGDVRHGQTTIRPVICRTRGCFRAHIKSYAYGVKHGIQACMDIDYPMGVTAKEYNGGVLTRVISWDDNLMTYYTNYRNWKDDEIAHEFDWVWRDMGWEFTVESIREIFDLVAEDMRARARA